MIDEKRAMELYRNGLNDVQIGRELGVTPSGVWHWRKRKNLKSNRPRRTGKKREKRVVKKKRCMGCGREYKPKRFDQKRCKRCTKAMRISFLVIRIIRYNIWNALQYAPDRARRLVMKMIKKEGEEFARYALGEKLLNAILKKD